MNDGDVNAVFDDVARILLIAPIVLWRNSIPFMGGLVGNWITAKLEIGCLAWAELGKTSTTKVVFEAQWGICSAPCVLRQYTVIFA